MRTIFIFGDRSSQPHLLQSTLRLRLGYQAVTATGDGANIPWALSMTQPQPDLALIDLQPCARMLQAVRRLSAFRPQLPIIALLDYGRDEQAALAVAAGAYDFLIKPFSIERLKVSMENGLKLRRVSRADAHDPGVCHFHDGEGRLKTLESIEGEAIRHALRQADGCITRAARHLGIGRSTLYRKLGAAGKPEAADADDYMARAHQTTRPMMVVSEGERS